MSSVTNVLAPVSLVAERAFFGQPDFTVVQTATNSALAATYTPADANHGQCRMFYLTLSFSAAPTAPLTLTVKDGTTVIWQVEISVSAPFVQNFDFSARPLRASVGAALSANIGASGAAVQTISWSGDTFISA